MIKLLLEEPAALGACILGEAEREPDVATGIDKVVIDDELVVAFVIGVLAVESSTSKIGEPERGTGRTTGRGGVVMDEKHVSSQVYIRI